MNVFGQQPYIIIFTITYEQCIGGTIVLPPWSAYC
jgi:hypothetical protein